MVRVAVDNVRACGAAHMILRPAHRLVLFAPDGRGPGKGCFGVLADSPGRRDLTFARGMKRARRR